MNLSPEQLNHLIRNRRSIFPKSYIDRPIPKFIIEEMLENANWAPTHKLTEPWRFRVFTGNALPRLGDELASAYKTHTPPEAFLEKKYEATRTKVEKSACIIAICMQRDPALRVPEWEEVAAVSCAVQNMWLSCTAHGIGSYWSSTSLVNHLADFLELKEGERCLGLFYMGYYKGEGKTRRTPIDQKVTWHTD